ncbi:MAG: serine/threonine protein kinase [Planctomycetaceae bacterium]
MKFFKKLFQRKPRLPRTDITRRFDLIGRVGQGSMSRVFRARDTMTGRVVALKILDKEKTRRFESRFSPELHKPTEGEIAVTLKHPHIVETYEWGTTREGEQFLSMEFIDGVGLSYLVEVQNPLMQRKRLSFMIQLGDAIDYFHEQGWIHRDICPRNVLVDADNSIKLIDFGLVVPNSTPFQAPGNRTGTANYMAPELIKRLRTDQRIDVYSYAVTCYELFAKRFPWKAAETLEMVVQHINSPPADIREFAPDIDEQVAATIMKGLKNDPAQRWPGVAPMVQQFREARKRQKEARRAKTESKQSDDAVATAPVPPAPNADDAG